MALFGIFPCDELDDGTIWLKSDYTLDCSDSENRRLHVGYAAIMLAMYPIGIPLLYSFLLLKDKRVLNPKQNQNLVLNRRGEAYTDFESKVISEREKNLSIQHTIFLWGSYRPRAWWFEIFECIRRISLTGALVFVRQGSQTQIAVGLLICIISGFIFALSWPFATFRDNALGMMSHVQLTGTMFSALLFKVGKNASLAYDQTATGWLLIILNGGVFIVMLAWVGCEILVDEGPTLRSRERQFLLQASFLFHGGSMRGRFMPTGDEAKQGDENGGNAGVSGGGSISSDTVSGNGIELVTRSPSSTSSTSENIITVTDVYDSRSSSSSFEIQNNPLSSGGNGVGGFLRRNVSSSISKGGVKLAKANTGLGTTSGASNNSTFEEEPPPSGRGSLGRSTSLAGGWSKEFSEEHDAYYYWNIESGETVWEKPASV